MNSKLKMLVFCLLLSLAGLWLSGCNPAAGVKVQILHTPVIATASEQVTFTARILASPVTSNEVEIWVNDASVKKCSGLAQGGTCTFTGGPYNSYQGKTVSYKAIINGQLSSGNSFAKQFGEYYFAVTDANHQWSKNVIPARRVGLHFKKVDIVFHRSNDYTSTASFITDAGSKINSVYGVQDLVKDPANLDQFNFYVYSRAGSVTVDPTTNIADCGAPDTSINQDAPWRDLDVVLHTTDMTDCTTGAAGAGMHLSAEGNNTKALLHESGHGIFGLGDEYDAAPKCLTNYAFVSGNEPNIFPSQADCQSEQTAKGRPTSACRKFTTCQGGWWGIHGSGDLNVMVRGDVNDPWGVEGGERVGWVFRNPSYGAAGLDDWMVAKSSLLLPIHYFRGQWQPVTEQMEILPCPAETPILGGGKGAPRVRLVDGKGKTVYEHTFYNDPRWILYEQVDDPRLLEKMPDGPILREDFIFYLRLPLVDGAQTLEFYDRTPLKEDEVILPVIQIDLSKAIARYQEAGGAEQAASCQDPEYVPDSLKK